MTEAGDALEGIIRFGDRLDSLLVGADYLDSPQKRRLDRYGAHVLSIIGAPLVAVASFAVHHEDGGPGIIQLPRVGRHGVSFGEYKIRSMVVGSENDPAIVGVKPVLDERATRVGRLLRAVSIDELPQARNILEGDMSLVGSRPKSCDEVQAYDAADADFFDAYTSMRPGLTGLEQIKGRGHATSVERIELTKEYAAEASLKLDHDILRKTIAVVALRHGAY